MVLNNELFHFFEFLMEIKVFIKKAYRVDGFLEKFLEGVCVRGKAFDSIIDLFFEHGEVSNRLLNELFFGLVSFFFYFFLVDFLQLFVFFFHFFVIFGKWKTINMFFFLFEKIFVLFFYLKVGPFIEVIIVKSALGRLFSKLCSSEQVNLFWVFCEIFHHKRNLFDCLLISIFRVFCLLNEFFHSSSITVDFGVFL